MLSRKIPFYYLLIAAIFGMSFSFFLFRKMYSNTIGNTAQIISASGGECDYNIERLAGYKHIRPLVWVHPNCESEKYTELKGQLSNLIQSYISTGVLKSASFDLRDLNGGGDWIAYDTDEKFNPGSLMKVHVMITILHMAEETPGLLDKEISFDHPFQRNVVVRFPDATITPGNKYTIRELLQKMIRYSDNDANDLLLMNIDTVMLKKTFSDFGFEAVKRGQKYPLTTTQFSDYMESLYNAGYLTIKDSEYALSLLASCNFKQGLVKGLPDSVIVAHKFGESDDPEAQEFHESGIVYLNDSPYLLTIMTKGPDIMKLPEVVAAISMVVFNYKTNVKKNLKAGIASN